VWDLSIMLSQNGSRLPNGYKRPLFFGGARMNESEDVSSKASIVFDCSSGQGAFWVCLVAAYLLICPCSKAQLPTCHLPGAAELPFSSDLNNCTNPPSKGLTCSLVKGTIPIAPGINTLSGCTISGTPRSTGIFTGDIMQVGSQQFQIELDIYAQGLPFDIEYYQVDYNGLPLNPEWYYNVEYNGNQGVGPDFSKICWPTSTPPDLGKVCTTQRFSLNGFQASCTSGDTILGVGHICAPDSGSEGHFRGHVNFQPVTYTGQLHFSDYSGRWPEDSDLNFSLTNPPFVSSNLDASAAGYTAGSVQMAKNKTSEIYPWGGFLTEFDASETVDEYFQSPWWLSFGHSAEYFTFTNELVYNDEPELPVNAVVTGLLGIDVVHYGGISELHPVFSMALHIEGCTTIPNSEIWEFFIRNQGDKGTCACASPTLEPEQPGGRDYYITLPWPNNNGHVPTSVSLTRIPGTPGWEVWPWVSGATFGGVSSTPGVGTYLDFKAPAYSSTEEVPFFGFDGYILLTYTYPDGYQSQLGQCTAPAKVSAHADKPHASKGAKPRQGNDAEDFPVDKILSSQLDPAVNAHLKKYFTQVPAKVPSTPFPAQAIESSVDTVAPRALSREAVIENRTRSLVNIAKQRRVNAMVNATGLRRQRFQAIDSQHVVILGADGILRLEEGQFILSGADGGKLNVASSTIDNGVQAFEAVSQSQVLALKDGDLFVENAPFGAESERQCIQGFVWRQANPRDHVCVIPAAHAQTEANNTAGPKYVAVTAQGVPVGTCVEGFVWRQADPTDKVCVTPEIRAQVAADNALGASYIAPPAIPDGTCVQGFGWRQADSTDHICVTPEARAQAATDNLRLRAPHGEAVNGTCPSGLVWREADPTDDVCVTSRTHAQTASDNALGLSRVARKLLASSVTQFKLMNDGSIRVLDAEGNLWSASAPLAVSVTPVLIAKNVRAFQAVDGQRTIVLTTDDRLQTYPIAAQNPVSGTYENVWAFQQTGDGSMFIIDANDTLWREAFVGVALHVHVERHPLLAVNQIDDQTSQQRGILNLALRLAKNCAQHSGLTPQRFQNLPVVDVQRVSFGFEQAGPVVTSRNVRSLLRLELLALVRHLQEQQVGELFDVVLIGKPRVPQDIAVIPQLLDDCC